MSCYAWAQVSCLLCRARRLSLPLNMVFHVGVRGQVPKGVRVTSGQKWINYALIYKLALLR